MEQPADDGGIVRPYVWHLTGVSPDEQLLHVTTFFGGVASDCNRWDGWQIQESADQVVIAARMWQDPDAEDCTDDGHQRDRYIRLEEPLGERELVGCQTVDCRNGPLDQAPGGAVDAAEEVLVAWSPAGRSSLDPADGTMLWREDEPGAGSWHAADSTVLRYDGRETTTAVDPADGTELWSVTGKPLGIVDDLVLTCRGETGDGTTRRFTDAHDLLSGATRWSAEIGCGRNVGTNDEALAVTGWKGDSGDAEMAALDPADGRERWRIELGQGGGYELVASGGRMFVGADGGILAVALADGSTTPVGVEAHSPIGAANGTVLAIGDGEVIAFDAHDGEVRWTVPVSDTGGYPPVIADGDALFVTDSAAGIVERRDPSDGQIIWSAEVGRSGQTDVAVHATTAFVATSVGVVALDLDTGVQRWWAPPIPE